MKISNTYLRFYLLILLTLGVFGSPKVQATGGIDSLFLDSLSHPMVLKLYYSEPAVTVNGDLDKVFFDESFYDPGPIRKAKISEPGQFVTQVTFPEEMVLARYMVLALVDKKGYIFADSLLILSEPQIEESPSLDTAFYASGLPTEYPAAPANIVSPRTPQAATGMHSSAWQRMKLSLKERFTRRRRRPQAADYAVDKTP